MMRTDHSGPGSQDKTTLDFYDERSEDYLEAISFKIAQMTPQIRRFIDALPDVRGPVLDWGAGPGQTSALLAAEDLDVEATDASPVMAHTALDLGIKVSVEPFEALAPQPRYRGIWSEVALCHAPRAMMPSLLDLAFNALLPGGIIGLRMKAGHGEGRDAVGRFFSYWQAEELGRSLAIAGFEILGAEETYAPSMVADQEVYSDVLARKS